MSEPKPDYSYLSQRLTALGISDQLNTFTRTWTTTAPGDDGKQVQTVNTKEYKLFDADEHGNIVIRYFNLNGQPYSWKKEGNKWPKEYVRLRLREPKDSMKYAQPAGSPLFPYFPPSIIAKYNEAKKAGRKQDGEAQPGCINTLYLVEGEFKAFKGTMHGLDIIGLPGIYGFFNGDIKGRLHEDIQELIVTCGVRKIVLLMDADVLSVNWAEGKDLSRRPLSFYGSIKAFRESLQLLIDDQGTALELVYWMHIDTKFMNDAKGLDDLLAKYEAKCVEIIEDLSAHQFAKKYFVGKALNDLSRDVQGAVFRYLGLADEKEFYKTYSDFIGAREFRFKRRDYVYDADKKDVVFVRHQDADKFLRIGPDWVKIIKRTNKYGMDEEELVPWKVTEIVRDYRHFPGFVDQIQRYDGLCNEPNWNGSFKRVVNNCYNVCSPLAHDPKEGPIPHTYKLLKHIFQGQGALVLDEKGNFLEEKVFQGDPFTVIMDYLTILIRHPKQPLPVPILVSPEFNTGKSTFLKWLSLIFGNNMCILGNEHFKMKFNAHYITKFIIAIDEGFLEIDKKAEKERLKMLVTADTAYVELKGMNLKKIDYYAKIIISSNDADRVMKIEEGENRWFVVRVPAITGPKDPDLLLKLREEVPAFLHLIRNREIFHPKSDRLWFKDEWFYTEQLRIIQETTKNRIDRVFEEWIREQFLLYKEPKLRYSLKRLTEIFNDQKTSKYKVDGIELKGYLEKKGLKPQPPQRVKIPTGFDMDFPTGPKVIYSTAIERPYEFLPEDWLSEEDLEEFRKPLFDGQGELVTKVVTKSPEEQRKKDELPF
jgi:hypothetical protein